MFDLSVASNERHERFIQRSVASGAVWVLQLKEEPHSWATSSGEFEDQETGEIETVPIVPFWSDRAYASRCARDKWAVYEPVSIPLEDFIEYVLQDMHHKGVLVGTNWSGSLVGHDVEPFDLAKELSEAAAAVSGPTGDGA